MWEYLFHVQKEVEAAGVRLARQWRSDLTVMVDLVEKPERAVFKGILVGELRKLMEVQMPGNTLIPGRQQHQGCNQSNLP